MEVHISGMHYTCHMLRIWKFLQWPVMIALGVFLLWLSLRSIDLQQLWSVITKGNIWVAVPVFIVSVSGYWIRSLRWKLLIETYGLKVETPKLFIALSTGYAINFATPRLGEIARCLVLGKMIRTPIAHIGFSVVVERLVDFACLMLLVLCATYLQFDLVYDMMLDPLWQAVSALPWGLLLIILLLLLVGIVLLLRMLRSYPRTKEVVQNIQHSLQSFRKLRSPWAFVLYTVLIWCCYFLMTWLWFDLYPETSRLGWKAALILMTIGSIGRSVPIQGGGMGAYHFLVSQAFTIFGVSIVLGNALAFVIHGAQMILTLALGLFCWIWMMYRYEKN